jgi:hypothetical protein
MTQKGEGEFDSPEARWAGVGPYYAMFPTRFADYVVEKYTNEGDTILDPFAGRGTSLFSAAVRGRHALGVEINPVGWVYAATKLGPTERWRVEERVTELGRLSGRFVSEAKKLPLFFQVCFSRDICAFLLTARKHLDWRNSVVDRTLMAILLIDLHGKRDLAFSNQMRQTKALSPDYAIRWWRDRDLGPPDRDPVELTLRKIDWRYARGVPNTIESRVYLADSTHRLPGLRASAERFAPKGVKLLFTSPPYLGVTNYHYDQWLRLWLLGGSTMPRSLGDKHRGKFCHPSHFRALLMSAFTRSREFLAPDAVIYVRTDRRSKTSQVTREVLREVFPNHSIRQRLRPLHGNTQTRLFGNGAPRVGEVDMVLLP